jgi:hypothetical protein
MSEVYILKLNDKVCGYYNNLNLVTEFIAICINCDFIKKTDNVKIYKYLINTNICIQEIDFFKKKIINHTNESYDLSLFYCLPKVKENIKKYKNKKENKSTKKQVINSCLYESTSDTSLSYVKTNNNLIDSDSESTTYSEYTRRNIIDKNKIEKLNEVGIEKSNITHKINILNLEKKKIKEKENEFNYDLGLYNKFKIMMNINSQFVIPELFLDKFKIFKNLDDNNNLTFESFYDNYVTSNIETDYDNMFNGTEHLNKFINKDDINLTFINESYDNLFKASHNLDELTNITKLQDEYNNSINTDSDLVDTDSDLDTKSNSNLDSD